VTRLVIAGLRGRMGQSLQALLADGVPTASGMELLGGIGRTGGDAGGVTVVPVEEAAALLRQADVVVDFSGAAGLAALLARAGGLKARALVTGSTGLDGVTLERLDDVARECAVLSAANFSVGVNLLLALVSRAAAALPADGYDIEIVEAHHGRKLDAPSGTALALAEAAARGRDRSLADVRRDGRSGETGTRPPGEIGIHAIRGGGVVGHHQVLFLGGRERIELNHEALDRSLFAEGALHAARWIAGRPPGRYGMHHVLGLDG
jgi:4-hydroxy-tetrahydrodipicolinate reductase